MSGSSVKSVSPSRARLMEVFNTELLKNGNDPFSAFIATLDELDQRQQAADARFQRVDERYENLTHWTEQVDDTLDSLPAAFMTASREAQGTLSDAASAGAAKGVQTGLVGLEQAVEALRGAEWALEDTRVSVRRKARWTVPLTVFMVVALLWFFNNAIIPVLPPTLEWPCSVSGLEYGRSGQGLDRFSYCIISR